MDINMPKGRDLATEYSKTLSAQIGILPNLLAAQAQYAPLQASSTLGNLSTLLLGSPGGSYDTQVYTPAVYRTGGKYSYGKVPPGTAAQIMYPQLPDNRGGGSSGGGFNPLDPLGMSGGGGGGLFGGGSLGMPGLPSFGGGNDGFDPLNPLGGLLGGGLFGGGGGPKKKLVSPSGYRTVTNTLGPQRGLIDIYTQDVAPQLGELERAQQSLQRGSDIADVARLGPEALAALKASDPATAALLDKMAGISQLGLDAGTQLSPADTYRITNAVRSIWAARGLGSSAPAQLAEALQLYGGGEDLLNTRLQRAAQAATLRNSIYGDPFQRILGRSGAGLAGSSNAINQAMGLAGMGTASNLLNPESGYAQDIYNTNFNALVNQAIGNANNQNALIGAGISSLGSLAGGAMGLI